VPSLPPDRADGAGTPDAAERDTTDKHGPGLSRLGLTLVGVAVLAVAASAIFLVLAARSDSGSSPAAAPASARAGASGTPAQVLRSLLNPRTMLNCAPGDMHLDGPYPDAALHCTSVDGVPIRAYHFPSQSALDREIGAKATYLHADDGDCAAGKESQEDWTSPQYPSGGTRVCYVYADKFVIFWTYGGDHLAFIAEHDDAVRLATWQRTFNPLAH
jgi:hypothetical protein